MVSSAKQIMTEWMSFSTLHTQQHQNHSGEVQLSSLNTFMSPSLGHIKHPCPYACKVLQRKSRGWAWWQAYNPRTWKSEVRTLKVQDQSGLLEQGFWGREERRRPGYCSKDRRRGTSISSEENTGSKGQLWGGVNSGEGSVMERGSHLWGGRQLWRGGQLCGGLLCRGSQFWGKVSAMEKEGQLWGGGHLWEGGVSSGERGQLWGGGQLWEEGSAPGRIIYASLGFAFSV